MRAAGRMAAESGWLVWNQGGSGDDVERAHPGHVVSILTPTSRYAEPFLRRLASEAGEQRVRGQRVTPFLLARVAELTGGESIAANRALLLHNAGLAARARTRLAMRSGMLSS